MQHDLNLFRSQKSLYFKNINSKKAIEIVRDEDGYYIDCSGDEKETRRIIDSLKSRKKLIAIKAGSNIFNRRVIETMKVNYLVCLEDINKRDGLKQRDSGLNHVLAKIIKKNNIKIVVCLSKLKELGREDKSIFLAKLIQNIKILRKADCELKIASFSEDKSGLVSKKDRQIVLTSLGCDSKTAQNSTLF